LPATGVSVARRRHVDACRRTQSWIDQVQAQPRILRVAKTVVHLSHL